MFYFVYFMSALGLSKSIQLEHDPCGRHEVALLPVSFEMPNKLLVCKVYKCKCKYHLVFMGYILAK